MPAPSFRQLPSVDRLLDQAELSDAIAAFGRNAVRDAARRLLDEARAEISRGAPAPDVADLTARLSASVHRELTPTLVPVLNATGIIIHTNLGRAPLSEAAQRAVLAVAEGYSNLEFDLDTGGRGSRHLHAERLICELTGAEAALVVNNAAAALTLILRACADGRDVIISRGELVEIGGGFRIPEILQQSGAKLVEVGTTNRTRLADYRAALGPDTAALLKVHQSNFKIIGFSEETPLAELAQLAREQSIPPLVIDDLGSGTLLDTRPFGLAYEPTVHDSVRAGADLVAFSGDKLLGGPQAGIIVGKSNLIAQLKREPLTRALRVDKLTLAALQATLLAYLRGTATAEIPIWQMISAGVEALAARAQAWADALSGIASAETRPGHSAIGGGALPGQTLPTVLLALRHPEPDQLAGRLRAGAPPVIARIEDDLLLFDPRTIPPARDAMLIDALRAALQSTNRP